MTTMQAWIFLGVAGLLEVGWAVGLKYSDGFSRPGASVATIACMIVSFVLLARAMQVLPVGTAYSVWTGIGAVGAATLGILLFGESSSLLRLAGIGLILAGIVVLRVAV